MTEKVIPLDLPDCQVELALVALYVLDHVHTGTPLPVEQLIAQALRFFDIRRRVELGHIGHVIDALFEPLHDSRLTPAERLAAIDPADLTDDEAMAIIRDMEAQHGPVAAEELGRAYPS